MDDALADLGRGKYQAFSLGFFQYTFVGHLSDLWKWLRVSIVEYLVSQVSPLQSGIVSTG